MSDYDDYHEEDFEENWDDDMSNEMLEDGSRPGMYTELNVREGYFEGVKEFCPTKQDVVDAVFTGQFFPDYETAKKCLYTHTMYMSGMNFAFLMKEDEGFRVWPRPNQPCQGGDMRTYYPFNPDCKSMDERPNDLFAPYPEKGNPIHVGFNLDESVKVGYATRAQKLTGAETIGLGFCPDSPYMKNRSNTSFEIVGPKHGGLVVLDTKIEPTLLVNQLQYMMTGELWCHSIWEEHGFSRWESLRMPFFLNTPALIPVLVGNKFVQAFDFHVPNNYYFTFLSDPDRVFNSDPRDMTGTTFYDRGDYNRAKVHDLFGYEVPDYSAKAFRTRCCEVLEQTLGTEMYRPVPGSTYKKERAFNDEQMMSAVRTVLDEYLNQSKERIAA